MKVFTSALTMLFFTGSALAQSKPPTEIPEPGVWALMGIGLAVFAARHLTKR